jgi:hypothetical protein
MLHELRRICSSKKFYRHWHIPKFQFEEQWEVCSSLINGSKVLCQSTESRQNFFFLVDHKFGPLPKVLQNEIWEYVRGDRAYWRQIYSNTFSVGEDAVMSKFHYFDGGVIERYYLPKLDRWLIQVTDSDRETVTFLPLMKWVSTKTLERLKERHKFDP